VRALAARALAAVVILLAAGFTLASPSLASGGEAPEFGIQTAIESFSTRVIVGVEYKSALESEWEAGYAPAEAGGQAPSESSPAWTFVNKGTQSVNIVHNGQPIFIGLPNAKDPEDTGEPYLRHLAPGTRYYARFVVKNADGEARKLMAFTTLSVGRPEVPERVTSDYAFNLERSGPVFKPVAVKATGFGYGALVETNGSETAYRFEYALSEGGHAPAAGSSAWKPFTSDPSGSITVAEEYAWVEARTSGLEPETTYYVRLRLSNAVGEVVQDKYLCGEGEGCSSFTTPTAKPVADGPIARNVTAASAFVAADVVPHESQTEWGLEWAEVPSGPWTAVPGGSGTISQAVAQAAGYDPGFDDGARLTGLKPSTVYYVRTVAKNSCGTGCGTSTSEVVSFETAGAPSASVFSAHGVHGEALRLLGSVNPNSPTSTAEQVIVLEKAVGGTFTLTFKGDTTAPIAYDASADAVRAALRGAGGPETHVEGLPGGPYTVSFSTSSIQDAQPPIEADGLGLAPGGSVGVTVTQQGGESYDTHYHFQYVSSRAFAEHGWSGAQEGPEEDAGSGTSAVGVGYDLPTLTAREGYRYRLVARSDAPGTGAVYSGEGSLTVPAPVMVGAPGSCGNEAFRTGPSANLPDCRAYELVSPVNKQGAKELLFYDNVGEAAGVVVGEDGEHVTVDAPVGGNWGTAGQSPYLFSRLEGGGWPMTTGAPQPQAGLYRYQEELSSADATQVAFAATIGAGEAVESTAIEKFGVGRVGGPYVTVASIPHAELGESAGWKAATGDFSKLVLATADRTLVDEQPTGTRSGDDLYEYTAAGGLRQLNVGGEQDETIGTCGARMVRGDEYSGGEFSGLYSSSHSISADGSRVFFYAGFGRECPAADEFNGQSGPKLNLYMRVNGLSTVDIGAYSFVAADAQGSRVLLRRGEEFFMYDTAAESVKHLFNLPAPEAGPERPVVSADFTDVYLTAGSDLYRYDIAGETLSLVTEGGSGQAEVSPDGRYYYYEGGAAGLPGGGVMRYDSVENVLECISCASPFAPEPKQPALLDDQTFGGVPELSGGLPAYTSVSGNGDFAFFTTPAALVPQDANGEIPIEPSLEHSSYSDPGGTTSPSSDVYEWRRDGVDGCARPQGCVALISDGRKGYHVDLLGVADEGRDVIFYSRSQLVPQDIDNAGDVYDARIGGGFAPPPSPPVECEGDACSTPPGAPNDVTPSSLTFNGAGNLPSAEAPKAKVTKPKSKKKIVKKKPKKKPKGKKSSKQAKKSARGRK
jgi:hypothetical protein